MVALFPDSPVRRSLLFRSILVGAALGVLAFAGAGLFLYDAEGLLEASTGFVVTLVAALAVGIWAGVPAAADDGSPPRGRWLAAGAAAGVAGVFATLWMVHTELRSGIPARVLALLLLVAAPVYLLGLLLPRLLVWAEGRADSERFADEREPAGRESGEPSGWEPLGTLTLGVLAGVALGALLAGLLLVPFIGAGPALLGTAAALMVPPLFADPPVEGVQERVLYKGESALSVIRVIEVVYPGRRQPERRLYQNEEEESGELVRSGAPALPYIAAAEQWLSRVAHRGDRYLFLGGGAYTLPRRVAERDPGARIAVVELDPEITRVAYRFFGVRPEHGITSVHGDARRFIERAAVQQAGKGERFDRVFMDVYGGNESLPYALITCDAFEAMGRLVSPGGTILINAIGVAGGLESRRLWSIVRTFCEVFPSVALYTHLGRDYPDRQNVLLAAAAEPGVALPDAAGLFERWPPDEWPGWEGTAVFHDLGPDTAGKVGNRGEEVMEVKG